VIEAAKKKKLQQFPEKKLQLVLRRLNPNCSAAVFSGFKAAEPAAEISGLKAADISGLKAAQPGDWSCTTRRLELHNPAAKPKTNG